MARPVKKGIDYFPLDVHLDDKFKLLEAKYKLTGFAVVIRLFQKIYADEGYYCRFDEDNCLLFASETVQDYDMVREIVGEAVKRGIFDKAMYEKKHILTSGGIQKRYLEATSRRSRVDLKQEYLLLGEESFGVNVYINGVAVVKKADSAGINTQSKEKKSKPEKKIPDDSKSDKSKPPGGQKRRHGTYQNVLLSDEDLKNLKQRFPDCWERWIETLSAGIELKGYEYQNHYLAILRWAENDRNKGPVPNMQTHRSRFPNYEDTNQADYAGLEEKLLDRMLDEGKDGRERNGHTDETGA